MSLFQRIRLAGKALAGKANDMSASALVGAGRSLGLWHEALTGFVPREVNPYFYEALRESLGPIDGGINRLVTIDGIIRVRGGNDKLVQMIETGLLKSVPVNDMESGLQAFYAGQGNELYEQGFTVGEMVMDAKGRELIGLRVADSKGVYFRRNPETLRLETWYRPPSPKPGSRRDGTDQLETILRNQSQRPAEWLHAQNFVSIDPARVVYAVFNPESGLPYGVSIMRSIEFVGQMLLKVQNATGHVWDRYGDPPLQLTYKTANRSLVAADLDKRRVVLSDELAKVLEAKRRGNSADFVQAVGKDDDITIKAIGTDGQALEIEMPARHMMEQILAKIGLPAWMLGMQWSTAERMAEQQSEVVLQESRTRFEHRAAGLRGVVETWLRGRGATWKPGDWELYQELPRLQDELKTAQAGFLNAQTAMMESGTAPEVGKPSGQSGKIARLKMGDLEFDMHAGCAHAKGASADSGEPWAEDDPELPKIEARAVAGMLALWGDLRDGLLRVLKLPTSKSAEMKAPGDVVWTFDVMSVLRAIADLERVFIAAAGGESGPLLQEAFRAWVRGLENAAAPLNAQAAIDATHEEMRSTLTRRGMDLVRNATVRALRDDILSELTSGAYDGLGPKEVARRLAQKFALREYDWERLARSEIAYAQVLGKEAQYAELGLPDYDWITASESCPICVERASAGPYKIGAGPLPMRDSHPECCCTITAHG